MQSQLTKPIILAGILLTLSCNVQGAEKVVVVPLFSATGDAAAADVLAGKTFSSATGKGLTGTRSPAPVAATGQTATRPVVAPSGSDGDQGKGVSAAIRFTDNGDGTVTDNLTDLVWLQDASCSDLATDKDTWDNALAAANGLAEGLCNLTDGSSAGDWRLPNLFELESLRDMSENAPSLTRTSGQAPGYPFTGVMPNGGLYSYWTSTTLDRGTTMAWIVGFLDGAALFDAKTSSYYIWPVRDAN
ncbi:MAG TPA: DUF1566 domain-containing protein [Desulfobulbaceae bacterium]|nr:DUF1566 domain-containing protein [Desulfobulbaceae bacterium]